MYMIGYIKQRFFNFLDLLKLCHMAITDAWLKANSGKARSTVEEKSDRDGLSCRISPKGKIVFQMRYRHDRKQCRVDIGTYPLTSLKSAREEALRLKTELEKGHDPRVVKKIDKAKNVDALSLNAIFDKWYVLQCSKKKMATQIKRSFVIYVLPKFGIMPPDKLSADNWMTLLEGLSRTKPAIATRILVNTKQMLSWSVRRKLIEHNQLSDIEAKRDLNIVNKPKSRHLNDDEVALLIEALYGSRMAEKNKLFCLLCLIYGCRNGELRVSKRSHFDLDKMLWTVPPENHKIGMSTGKPLVRPIIDEIKVLIERCLALGGDSEYLFTNAGTNEPMGKGAPLPLPYNIIQWIRKNKGIEIAHWSIHDLRKTARTNFSTLTQPHIAEIMLGHKLPGQWQVYDQHLYLDEQVECLVKWIERLRRLGLVV